MGNGEVNVGGYPCTGLASHPGGSKNTSSRFMPQDKLWPARPLNLDADFTLPNHLAFIYLLILFYSITYL